MSFFEIANAFLLKNDSKQWENQREQCFWALLAQHYRALLSKVSDELGVQFLIGVFFITLNRQGESSFHKSRNKQVVMIWKG